MIANMVGNMSVNDNWVVDSGATEHITHQGHLFKNLFMNIIERPATIPNEESIPVKGKGKVDLKAGNLIEAGDCRGGLN
ncbi:hypothetical protein Tco_1554778 [Tanacetum coccineum]